MSDGTHIGWTDATWNVFVGCTKISPGCKNCSAQRDARRLTHNPHPAIAAKYAGVVTPDGANWTGKINFDEATLGLPLRWRKPRRIFVNYTSDTFHADVPDEWIDKLFAVMALCHQHTFQVLTKRPDRMLSYLRALSKEKCRGYWFGELGFLSDVAISNGIATKEELNARFDAWRRANRPDLPDEPQCIGDTVTYKPNFPLKNVWLGTSVENQKEADERIPFLLETPAAVRWISAEPLLGPVDLTTWLGEFRADGWCFECHQKHPKIRMWGDGAIVKRALCDGCAPSLDWVVAGGESGKDARPIHPDWARSLRDQCETIGVPFFYKQHGNWLHQSQEYADGLTGAECSRIVTGKGAHKWPDGTRSFFINKRAAGAILDGREWNQYPEARA